MTVECQTISVSALNSFPKGSIIQVTSKTSGGSGHPVEIYEWYMDSTILPDNKDIIIINTSDLNIGVHALLLKAKNSCNSWGSYSQSFYITAACDNLITSFNIQIL